MLSYLWFPFMVIPLYAGFERLPSSLLEASGDLGALPARTFRRVILPLSVPGIAAGSKTPNKEKVGKVTKKQVLDIVKIKLPDMNATNEEAAARVIAGTARSMGIEVVG